MTLGELTAIVLNNLERTGTDSAVDTSNAQRWVNEAIRFHFCTRHNWDAMERTHSINTVADQDLYGFPSEDTKDIQTVALRVSDTSPYCILIEESEDQLDHNFNITRDAGLPLCWGRAGNAIRLRPVPSVSTYGLRVRSWQYPALMVDPAETNYWTVSHWDMVLQIATALGHLWLGRADMYQQMWPLIMQGLDGRINDDMKRLRPKRKTISPSGMAGRPGTSAGRQGNLGIYRQYP